MGATWYRARANLRQRIGGTLLLILFVAVPGGIVLASIAGAQRTHDAVPDFVRYARPYDTQVFFFADTPGADRLRHQVAALPQWETEDEAQPGPISVSDDGDWVIVTYVGFLDRDFLRHQERPIVVAGRLPDPDRPDEVAINESMAAGLGLTAGDTLQTRTITPDQVFPLSAGTGSAVDPDGAPAPLHVTAIIRRPSDLRTTREEVLGQFGPETWHVVVGPAFVEQFHGQLGGYGTGVLGRPRPGQSDELTAAVADLAGDRAELSSQNEYADVVASVQRGVDFEQDAVLLFALVTGLTAVALVGQALARQVTTDLDGDGVLRGAGMGRRQRAGVPLVRASIVADVGALGAVLLAVALSSLFPIDIARQAALSRGIDVDVAVLGPGFVIIAALVLGWVSVVAWRRTGPFEWGAATTAPSRTTTLTGLVRRAAAPLTVVEGVRLAVERGRGRTAVPVVGAMAATAASVVLLTATLVFSSSLDQLVTTPALQGWNWDVTAGNLVNADDLARGTQALEANPRVARFVAVGFTPLDVDSQPSYSFFIGPGDLDAGPRALEGRIPVADDEIALGPESLDRLHKHIGEEVRVRTQPGQPAFPFRIVGTVTPPAALDGQLTLGKGVLLTYPGIKRIFAEGEASAPQTFLITYTPGTTFAEGADSLKDAFGGAAPRVPQAEDVANLQRVERVPRLLAVLVALLALGTLGNALVTSVRRRRRTLATFSTLGFRRRQLAGTVAWQATTFALVGLVIGVPLGVAAGRLVWSAVMGSIGTDIEPVVPIGLLAVMGLATVVAANVIAALPARSAARTHPAEILRSE